MQTNELPKNRFPKGNSAPKTGRKKLYFSPKEGTYTIRLLDASYKRKYSHFVQNQTGIATIQCLLDVCPICLENDRIRSQYPEDYRDVPGYSPQSLTCTTNIIDLTPVKECECGLDNYVGLSGDYPNSCSCGKSLLETNPTPSNKVKIFSRGKTLFDQMSDFHSEIKASSGMDINQYNLTVIARKRTDGGKGSNLSLMPRPDQNQPLTGEYEGYNLDFEPTKLSAEEMLQFRSGVSIRDIFAARGASNTNNHTKPAEQSPVADTAEKVNSATASAVADMVGNYFNQ